MQVGERFSNVKKQLKGHGGDRRSDKAKGDQPDIVSLKHGQPSRLSASPLAP